MNVLFFKITPTTAVSQSEPIGSNAKIEITDLYSDDSLDLGSDRHSHIKTFSYNEETKELLVIRPDSNTGVPA
jgi:hypothetical protein